MKRAWAGEAIEVGEPGARQPVRIAPLPVQQPHPELWVAAFGPLALKQAGELGLPYLSSPLETIGRLTRNHELHREALPQGALRPIVPVMRTVFISEDRATCDRVRSALTAQALRMARAGTRLVQEEELADIEKKIATMLDVRRGRRRLPSAPGGPWRERSARSPRPTRPGPEAAW